ncbi:probable cation-transporting ATPase 13A4 [Anolis sagrei]|uniref:probable cation-transporting ATPase 13A4 n=1 Tax=Anolis sagrei TaxID=38937 RepID=UPI0035230282
MESRPDSVPDCFHQRLEAVTGWLRASRLRVNPAKTEILWPGRPGSGDLQLPTLDGEALRPSSLVKSLGVLLDPLLRMEAQEMFGYKTQGIRRALCIAGYVFSCGGLLLLFYWKPEWDVWANCAPCSLEEADVVLLRTTDEFHVYTRKKVTWVSLSALNDFTQDHPAFAEDGSLLSKVIMKPELKVRCLRVQKVCYAWDASAKRFLKVGALEEGLTCAEIHAKFGAGLNREEQDLRRTICGSNTIDVEITPIWKLLFKEVLNPFYIFQLFSVCLWLSEDYIEYSVAIILMSLLSVSLTVYDLRKQSVKLHRLVESHNSVRVTVCAKETGAQELDSRGLVPGDLLVLGAGRSLLTCDAILISGQCTVNEGMLTGESIPVTKTALPLDPKDHRPWPESCAEDQRRHLLFCGTELIQAKGVGKGPARAVVLRTGFNTAKGDLVRSILYPKPLNFRLYRDALRFLMCLIGVAAIGMVYAVCVFVLSGEEAGEVIKKALDVITIAVPPALPAALTTGIIYAQRRLKKRGIFCISPQRINVCGQINLICFDKTGTLTEDGLDLWGAVLAEGKSFQSAHRFSSSASPLPWGPAFAAMATCHSLVVLDGKIQGDPLDLKMFQATQWEIEDSSSNDGDDGESTQVLVVRPGAKAEQVVPGGGGLAVLRQFPFSSALQRMSVVAQDPSGQRHVFTKGAPEKVALFCRPETVPPSFTSELQLHTSRGFRVIGLAHKSLPEGMGTDSLNREAAESGLTFLGLLVMENRLKGETRPVLEELRDAHIRTVMVTGDNIQTAITVAKDAGMIPPGSQVVLVEADASDGQPSITWSPLGESKADAFGGAEESCVKFGGGQHHFCLSGRSYEAIGQHFGHLLPGILLNGTVFARMSPAQKAKLVQDFQKLDYFVGMCGDGANDCGALKVAHAGISLSEQEASVASPFTSQIPNIQCVPELVRQGRAALVTSFCMFKYMALYSIIQYIGVLLLYWQTNSFGNYQFLFQDLAINTLIGLTMSLNGAHPKLVPFRPPARLTSPPLLLSMVLNLLFSLSTQVCGFVLVQRQPWYHKDLDSFSRACAPSNGSSLEPPSVANLTLGVSILPSATEAPTATVQEEDYRSYENTSVWLLSTISCLMVAVVFSKGKPFRKPIYQNYLFVLVLVVQLAVCLFLLFANIEDLYVRMELVCTPMLWRVSLLIMLLVNFAVSFMVEEAIIENRALWRLLKRAFGYQSSSQYKKLQRSLNSDPSWPPLNKMDFSGATTIHMDIPGATYINPGFESDGEPACSLRL